MARSNGKQSGESVHGVSASYLKHRNSHGPMRYDAATRKRHDMAVKSRHDTEHNNTPHRARSDVNAALLYRHRESSRCCGAESVVRSPHLSGAKIYRG